VHDLKTVDILRERLEASYTEAKEALDVTEGDVVGALAYLEQKRAAQSSDLATFVRETIEQVRSVAKDQEVRAARVTLQGQPLFTLPLALVGAAAGAAVLVSAILNHCRVEVTTGEREDGESVANLRSA
jgi:CBS-domain-containing membrane protein